MADNNGTDDDKTDFTQTILIVALVVVVVCFSITVKRNRTKPRAGAQDNPNPPQAAAMINNPLYARDASQWRVSSDRSDRADDDGTPDPGDDAVVTAQPACRQIGMEVEDPEAILEQGSSSTPAPPPDPTATVTADLEHSKLSGTSFYAQAPTVASAAAADGSYQLHDGHATYVHATDGTYVELQEIASAHAERHDGERGQPIPSGAYDEHHAIGANPSVDTPVGAGACGYAAAQAALIVSDTAAAAAVGAAVAPLPPPPAMKDPHGYDLMPDITAPCTTTSAGAYTEANDGMVSEEEGRGNGCGAAYAQRHEGENVVPLPGAYAEYRADDNIDGNVTEMYALAKAAPATAAAANTSTATYDVVGPAGAYSAPVYHIQAATDEQGHLIAAALPVMSTGAVVTGSNILTTTNQHGGHDLMSDNVTTSDGVYAEVTDGVQPTHVYDVIPGADGVEPQHAGFGQATEAQHAGFGQSTDGTSGYATIVDVEDAAYQDGDFDPWAGDDADTTRSSPTTTGEGSYMTMSAVNGDPDYDEIAEPHGHTSTPTLVFEMGDGGGGRMGNLSIGSMS